MFAAVLVVPAIVSPASAHAAAPTASKQAGPVAKSASTEGAAETLAAEAGTNVEITSLRDESSETFATPDGDREVIQHLRPVRARVDGAWKAVDNTLIVQPDGSVAPRAAAVGMRFSGGGDGEPLVELERVGRRLAFAWPMPLSKPTLAGDTAVYAAVLPGVDLTLRADVDGFHQLLVVHTPEAAENPELAELTLDLQQQGLKVQATADGGFEAVDVAAGGVVFAAPQPIMWDSTGVVGARTAAADAETLQAPGDTAQVAPVGLEVPAGGGELRLTPDQELLTGADTVWPVVIDPQTYTPKAGDWTMVSRYWHDSPQYRFNNKSDEGVGLCEWSYCAPYDLKRLFFKVPTSKFAGKTITEATFIAHETWSASCDGRSVQLWRTKGFTSGTTWDSSDDNWLDHLDSRDVAYGGDGCAPDHDVEFNALAGVKYAAAHDDSYTSFGLRATNEDDKYAWKRFTDDAYLRVTYNVAPKQPAMSQLTMSPGGDCDVPTAKDWVRIRPTVIANNITDPDGDRIGVQFGASWDTGDGKGAIMRWSSGKPAATAFKASGSDFSIPLPSTVPANKQVSWYVRVFDGAAYSPWSWDGSATGCYFQYDTSVPAGPVITSGDYPRSDPGDPADPWYDGAGRYGAFTFDAASTDVVRYCFGLNGDPDCAKNPVATTGGAAKSIQVLPDRPGLNFVSAVALDSAGNMSGQEEQSTYYFRVKTGQPSKAQWELNESAGATEAAGSAERRPMTLAGDAKTGAVGTLDGALQLDGAGDYAHTDLSAVETGESFSVSAWVKLSELPADGAVAVSQLGNNRPGFDLYYSKSYDRWVFANYSGDVTGATQTKAMAAAPGGVTVDKWTHLVGVAAVGDAVLRLYVDGVLVGTTPRTAYWNARRGLQIGASSYDDTGASLFFPGAIDDVKLFDKPLSDTEVTQLFNKQSIGGGRPAVSHFRLDEPATQGDGTATTEINGPADVNPATFYGGAKPGEGGVDGKALTLDGVDDYAATAGPHLETRRSLSVAAWVKLPATRPTTAGMVATQVGVNRGAFELYYSNLSGWQFSQPAADTATAANIRAGQSDALQAVPGQWTLLVGVRDDVTQQLRLYVNGQLVQATANPNSWYGGGATMIGATSAAGVKKTFFTGQIDDVQLYDRVLSPWEISERYKARPLVEGRWKLDAATGTPAATPDDIAVDQHPATLGGGAVIDASGSSNYVGTGGLLLDPDGDGSATGYAATTLSPVKTNTSFSASAWVTTPARPQQPVTVMSQAGANTNGFAVRYVPDPPPTGETLSVSGHWQLTMADADSTSAGTAAAEHTNFQNSTSWNHLAVVYDAAATQLRLYVDGELRQTVCADDDGDGTPNEPACTTAVSWNSNVLGFDATKGLQLGRAKTGTSSWGEFWPGAIDDVWMFQGVLSDTQIAALAYGTELATSPGP